MPHYYVTFAKAKIVRRNFIPEEGVLFGGHATTPEGADKIARECVNEYPGTILPKIVQVEGDYRLIDAMYEAEEAMEGMLKQMAEIDENMNHAQDFKRKRK